jgi:hypothetical protein
MDKSVRNNKEQADGGEPHIGRVETIHVNRGDALFSTVVYIENPHRPCRVVFTRTHFAWKPLKTIFVAPLVPFVPGGIFSGVPWSAINLVEFEYRRGDHEKLIRVGWASGPGESANIEITRVMMFNDWVGPFHAVGFSPPIDNPLRVTTFRGFLCDYGPTIWILLLFVCSFILFQFWREAWAVFPAIVHLLALPLWFWAIRKARGWFPPGTRIALHRRERTKS